MIITIGRVLDTTETKGYMADFYHFAGIGWLYTEKDLEPLTVEEKTSS